MSRRGARQPEPLPLDFELAIDAAPGARASWERLAPGHRREHLAAIEEAKRPETRARRIATAVEALVTGQRRPVTPSTKSLAEKLLLKPGMTLVVLLAPQRIETMLDPLPSNVTLVTRPSNNTDAVLFFARDGGELARGMRTLLPELAPDVLLWVAYPKQTGQLKSDLNRDVLNRRLAEHGFQGVAQVAVDDTWTASRFRRTAATHSR